MRLGVYVCLVSIMTMASMAPRQARAQQGPSAEAVASPGQWTTADESSKTLELMKRLSLDGEAAYAAEPLILAASLDQRDMLNAGAYIDSKTRALVQGESLINNGLPVIGFASAVQYQFNLAGANLNTREEVSQFSNGILRSRRDGLLTYTVAIDSADAAGLRIHFKDFDLPEGAEVYIYSYQGKAGQVEGPYTGKGPIGNTEFWSNTLFDAVAFIELQVKDSVAKAAQDRISFTIEEVAYLGGPYFFGGRNRFERNQEVNFDCVTDANCNQIDWPEIDTAKNGIALMSFPVTVGTQSFIAQCTGGLLNDAKPNTFVPYFLTANHCISIASEAAGLECFWRFSTFECSALIEDDFGAPPAPRTVNRPVEHEPAGTTGGPDIAVSPDTLEFTLPQTTNNEIFVEIDWMEDSTHSHRPDDRVINRIIQTFGSEGFRVNIVLSNAIPHQDALNITTIPLETNPDIAALVNQHFDNRNDPRYYYSIWGHDYAIAGQVTGSSGIADLPGRVHLVTLGSFPESRSFQAGTFVHEFGHNLGQTHGGADHNNYKPNYLSVMNYFYQLDGIGASLFALGFKPDANGFNNYGYSHGLQAALDETNLNEAIGLGLGTNIDWDCDGTLNETGVMKDLQSDFWCFLEFSQEVLNDFDNWETVNGFVRTGAGGVTPQALGVPEPCITIHEYNQLRQQMLNRTGLTPEIVRDSYSRLAGLEPDDLGPPPPQRNITAEGSFTIQNVGDATLQVTTISTQQSAQWITLDVPGSLTLAPGGMATVGVNIDFALAPPGQTVRRLLIASNDPDENPYPNGVDIIVNNAGMSAPPIAPDLEDLPSTLGAGIMATGFSSDFTLLQLAQDPPPGSTFFGWTTNIPQVGAQLFRLHHPAGLPLSYTRHTRITPFYVCSDVPPTHFLHTVQNIGATRGGSSGSPLMNRRMQIVGQLFGACGTNPFDICANDFSDTIDGRFTRTFPSIQHLINNPGPDLKVTSLVLNKTRSRPGRPISATVKIKNRGKETASNFVLRFFADSPGQPGCGQTADVEIPVGSIAPGQVLKFTIPFTTPGALGKRTARAFVDADCIVEESDEANNTLGANYTVRQ
jgi:hypothetical protein